MDIHQCEVFADLSETQNISKTAERLGYSQPGVSHILKTMEEECGFPLAIRQKYGLMLTPMGEQLLPAIRSLLKRRENLMETITAINGLEEGSLSIGTYSSISIHLLPNILQEFKKLHPTIQFSIREGGVDGILKDLHEHYIDFAFMSVPESFSGDFIPLMDDPLIGIFPKGSEYVKAHKKLVISDISTMNFILSAAGNDYDINAALKGTDVAGSANYSFFDDRSIISMVSSGLGMSILSELIIRGMTDKLDILPLYPPAKRVLGIACLDKTLLSPAARTFIEFSKNFF
ncbi:MAG: LysR family transcriptional regulator [Lachnospiraceae bacterium]|nr:LysR family transcriptional regulator [Lachnospiraceae bacterium]